jgi:hypothetical protein
MHAGALPPQPPPSGQPQLPAVMSPLTLQASPTGQLVSSPHEPHWL